MPGRMGPAGRGGARRRTRRRTTRRTAAVVNSSQQAAAPQEQAAAPQQQAAASPTEQLEQLGKLHEQGVITDEEFEEKKTKLLAEI